MISREDYTMRKLLSVLLTLVLLGTLLVPFASARLCSLEEKSGEALPVTDDTFTLSFRPFEIVTLRLSRKA